MKWDDLRFFLALEEAGSIKGAARHLGVDHSTVSRRLTALEGALGKPLFDRRPDGLHITEVGAGVVPLARRIASLAAEVEDVARGADESMAGPVRIAAGPVLTTYFLMPRLPALREKFPVVEFILRAAIARLDVTQREADIAIRVHPRGTPPGKADALARKVGTFGLAAYASEPYIAARGRPELPIRGLAGHGIVISSAEGEGAKWNARLDPPAEEVLTAYPYSSTMAAVESGVGLAVLPCVAAESEPTLIRISEVIATWDLWVVSPPEGHAQARVRAVKDALVEMLEEGGGEISGTAGASPGEGPATSRRG